MQTQKYSIQQPLIESLLSWVKEGEIAIPEIQRPFVWDKSKVRDLMVSIYRGYPVGYIITWFQDVDWGYLQPGSYPGQAPPDIA